MRTFSSYGPINTKLHYYAPRQELLDSCFKQLTGNNPDEGGHYITVWAPRQTGKTWMMREVFFRLKEDPRFDAVKINLEVLKTEKDVGTVLQYIEKQLASDLHLELVGADTPEKFEALFLRQNLTRPLVLILDEFDALPEEAISALAGVFRNIFFSIRENAPNVPDQEKKYLLHSVALIGIRSALGVENVKGSPFNVQRIVHIPNLTFAEVEAMFRWYEKERGQQVPQEVIERLYYETRGQPGLTCWLGELLTEGSEQVPVAADTVLDMELFNEVYQAAVHILPNNNILNIISKAKQEPYKRIILHLIGTKEKIQFNFDKPEINFLYLNGVIDIERTKGKSYARFASPFIQKRLFNYFSEDLFEFMGELYNPLEELDNAISEGKLNVRNIVEKYSTYLQKNRDWILKNAPRRSDMRVYEAVFHFNLYRYLSVFLDGFKGEIYPEFPTGNGKIDLIIKYAGQTYGIEVKTFKNRPSYRKALRQAAFYGEQLALQEISLIFFIEEIDDANRQVFERESVDPDTGVRVMPVFVETGR